MPTTIPTAIPEQPHLISLVLQSKKALQHGEQLCSRAHARSNASAQAAIDVLALDAKVRWITEAVIEQLRLAASVAKSIEEKRVHLGKQVQAWDTSRTKHTDALDAILESLGTQLVLPEFHQSPEDSSLFGSQHSDLEAEASHKQERTPRKRANGQLVFPQSPSATLCRHQRSGSLKEDKSKGDGEIDKGKKDDRKRWKTLRDFVDDQAIEDIYETIEDDRMALDVLLSKTDDFPETLSRTIASIHDSLPESDPGAPILTLMQNTLTAQEANIASMAGLLESLASHYDQMAGALKESEAGEAFSEEDLQNMNRDTEELPAIMSELEENAKAIEGHHEHLLAAQDTSQKELDHLNTVLDDLDQLGDIMGEILQNQESVEAKCEEELNSLHRHLQTLNHLHERYVAYQTAFSKLIIEISRRRSYREAAENIVRGMMTQLRQMTEEEDQVRNHFNAQYGAHLPEDICLCIGNPPTKWEVVPWEGDTLEVLPEIEPDLLVEARERVGITENVIGTESL